jgi:hypothetical protein
LTTIEQLLKSEEGSSDGVFLETLFDHAPHLREQFIAMKDDIRVSVADLEAILPSIRDFGLELIRAYEADPRKVRGEKIVVLGHVIVVEGYTIRGKGSELKIFQGVLSFVEKAIVDKEAVWIYFFPDLGSEARKIVLSLKQANNAQTLEEIMASTELLQAEIVEVLQFLLQHRIVSLGPDPQSYNLTRKGRFCG